MLQLIIWKKASALHWNKKTSSKWDRDWNRRIRSPNYKVFVEEIQFYVSLFNQISCQMNSKFINGIQLLNM